MCSKVLCTHLGGPVLVRVAGVETIVEGRLHQAVELGAEAGLEGLHVALTFAPLGSSVLEPNLGEGKIMVENCNRSKSR